LASRIPGPAVAVSPAALVRGATMLISYGTDLSPTLFLTDSVERLVFRFVGITFLLDATFQLLGPLLSTLTKVSRARPVLGDLVRTEATSSEEIEKTTVWVIRPFQGVVSR